LQRVLNEQSKLDFCCTKQLFFYAGSLTASNIWLCNELRKLVEQGAYMHHHHLMEIVQVKGTIFKSASDSASRRLLLKLLAHSKSFLFFSQYTSICSLPCIWIWNFNNQQFPMLKRSLIFELIALLKQKFAENNGASQHLMMVMESFHQQRAKKSNHPAFGAMVIKPLQKNGRAPQI
jgi:hypothetical protein